MAKYLKVIEMDNGEVGVNCPRCDDFIIPEKEVFLDGYICTGCGQAIEAISLAKYFKALKERRETDG